MMLFCNMDPCGDKPEWSDWGHWSECSVTCGAGGTRSRGRICSKGHGNGGIRLGLLISPCGGSPQQLEECASEKQCGPPGE